MEYGNGWYRLTTGDIPKNIDCAKGRVVKAIAPAPSHIPWSVNSFLQHKSSTFGNVHLKWYILHRFKGQRRLMSWALTKNRLILRPYNSDFLLTTTSVMNNDEGNVCVFTQRKVFRSLEVFSFTYIVIVSCCHF